MTASRFRRVCCGLLCAASAAGAADAAPICAHRTLAGLNVAGGEFNPSAQPGVHGRDYVYPASADVRFARGLGMRLIRVPVLWERLQRERLAPLDDGEVARVEQVAALASAEGMTMVLDLHNYGRYRGTPLGNDDTTAFDDVWRRIAARFARSPQVVFGLMNEPHDIAADTWATLARSALAAIRAGGARNVVLVPGTRWDGAHSWFDGSHGSSNADALAALARDDGVVFEVHQYFDANFSGTGAGCDGAARVAPALSKLGAWARAHRTRLFLGEFGASRQPSCVQALDVALDVVERDRDVWFGWSYWAGGPWWGDYPFNVQVADGPAPQALVLARRAAALEAAPCEAREGRRNG